MQDLAAPSPHKWKRAGRGGGYGALGWVGAESQPPTLVSAPEWKLLWDYKLITLTNSDMLTKGLRTTIRKNIDYI